MRTTVGDVSRIGDRLRESIPTARGEQKALAHKAGVTPETLNRILSGSIKEPGFETVAKIARAAGLDVNRLIAETGEPQMASSLVTEMISLGDRRRMQELADWLAVRFGIIAAQGVETAAPATTSVRPGEQPGSRSDEGQTFDHGTQQFRDEERKP